MWCWLLLWQAAAGLPPLLPLPQALKLLLPWWFPLPLLRLPCRTAYIPLISRPTAVCSTLTVENGVMTFHVSLASKKIVNLYPGLAADAEANKTAWLIPTVDTVTYADSTTEEVYGYDIPVEALDTDFQLALLGTKGKWYDHIVSVRNAEPKTEQAAETPADGAYTAAVVLEGGSGRATVESPAALTVAEGKMTATIVWSSPNYDYMIVDGEKYLPTNTEGNSTFEIPVAALGTPLSVVADTVAMSTPHEIEYTLTFTLN